jgi:hypothetical protein
LDQDQKPPGNRGNLRRFHEPTIAYVNRRTTEGRTKKEILRCLKRLLIREIYQIIVAPHKKNNFVVAA